MEKTVFLEDSERILKESEKEKGKYTIQILGKDFIIYPGVFSPKYFSDSKFFYEALPINKGEVFLEMGCGSGIIAVLAALRGASKVVAIDINPKAVENTKENAEIHNVSDRIKILKGDLFNLFSENDKFDTIFWNFPFGNFKKENLSMIQKALFDPGYKSFEKFVKGSRNYLKENGRLILGFSETIGDYEKVKEILTKYGFNIKLIAERIAYQGNPDGVVGNYKKVKYQLFEAFQIG